MYRIQAPRVRSALPVRTGTFWALSLMNSLDLLPASGCAASFTFPLFLRLRGYNT